MGEQHSSEREELWQGTCHGCLHLTISWPTRPDQKSTLGGSSFKFSLSSFAHNGFKCGNEVVPQSGFLDSVTAVQSSWEGFVQKINQHMKDVLHPFPSWSHLLGNCAFMLPSCNAKHNGLSVNPSWHGVLSFRAQITLSPNLDKNNPRLKCQLQMKLLVRKE